MPRRPALSWNLAARMTILALALSLGATARAKDDLCQSEKSAWDRALEREIKARQALEAYDNGDLAPLVPGQADAERQRLQDKLDATWEDVKRAMAAHDRCVKRRTCKKAKGGWLKRTWASITGQEVEEKPATKKPAGRHQGGTSQH